MKYILQSRLKDITTYLLIMAPEKHFIFVDTSNNMEMNEPVEFEERIDMTALNYIMQLDFKSFSLKRRAVTKKLH